MLPVQAIIFDFDGVILDSAGVKLDAYATIYAGEDPARVAELMRSVYAQDTLQGRQPGEGFGLSVVGRRPIPDELAATGRQAFASRR